MFIFILAIILKGSPLSRALLVLVFIGIFAFGCFAAQNTFRPFIERNGTHHGHIHRTQ